MEIDFPCSECGAIIPKEVCQECGHVPFSWEREEYEEKHDSGEAE